MFLGHSDDAINNAPEVHRILFENDQVRVLSVIVPPGHKTATHWHPKNMVYVISPGKLSFALSDGTKKEVELSQDQITSGEGVHAVENIGKTEVKALQIEFKL